jgi:hypothetical protein
MFAPDLAEGSGIESQIRLGELIRQGRDGAEDQVLFIT